MNCMYVYECENQYIHTGYRRLYGLKTKDDILKAIKKWYSYIAELHETHTLLVVMRDNAGENKFKENVDFLESH
jgi:hypothetical protein